jgi:hypothetical protein
METIFSANSAQNYKCLNCNTTCFKKNDWDRHLLTDKHKRKSGNVIELKILPKNHTCNCGKNYVTKSGLWKHKKICNDDINKCPTTECPTTECTTTECTIVNNFSPDNFNFLTNLVMEVVKNNSELLKQNQEFQKQVLDVCQKIQPNTNTTINNNNNSHNKTFNLNFFLNEQCKDAMNIMEFVDTFQLQFADLERVGEVGYVEGISSIIIDKLNKMDIYKRPIHCTDAKREIMHIKDNDVWSKDNENKDKLRLAIKHITKKNMDLVNLWADNHPGVRDYDHRLNNKYQIIIIESVGGKKNETMHEGETKIIKKISKMVMIDKHSGI